VRRGDEEILFLAIVRTEKGVAGASDLQGSDDKVDPSRDGVAISLDPIELATLFESLENLSKRPVACLRHGEQPREVLRLEGTPLGFLDGRNDFVRSRKVSP
jgi:hypothetical protein